jgi:putative transposase
MSRRTLLTEARMPNYRRACAKGGTFFFTVVSYRRRPTLCDDDVRRALRRAVRAVQSERPFCVDAWVLLPDHLHCIWTLPSGDSDFSTRWAMIKRYVTKLTATHVSHDPLDGACQGSLTRGAELHKNGARSAPYDSPSRQRRNEGRVWQRRFWEHTIRDQKDLKMCVDYLHWNPVKHGHVSSVTNWPFSTFHRYVRQGLYPQDWGGDISVNKQDFGE